SVPTQSVEATGIVSSTNSAWSVVSNDGVDIRITNDQEIPIAECHSIFIGILGTAEFEARIITGTMAWNGPQTVGNDESNDNSTTSVAVEGILPIELLRFDAIPGKNDVKLEWKTATELNNSHFEIERSADGRNFQPIG